MSSPQSARRPGAVVVVQSLLWLWLVFLSVLVALGYQALSDQADQERLDSRLQRLEVQATGLAETIEAIQQRPAVATDADLKDTRQILEARAAQVEKSLSGYAAADGRSSRSRRARPLRPFRSPPHPPSRAHRARPPPSPNRRRFRSASSAPNCALASAACPSRRAPGTSRPPNFRCCCPGMRSARGACRRSRATPQCSRPATTPAAWRFPDRSTP